MPWGNEELYDTTRDVYSPKGSDHVWRRPPARPQPTDPGLTTPPAIAAKITPFVAVVSIAGAASLAGKHEKAAEPGIAIAGLAANRSPARLLPGGGSGWGPLPGGAAEAER